MPAKFIVIEGPNNSGKTTFINKLHERLKTTGIQFIATRDPEGTQYGETLRGCLKTSANLHPFAQALGINSARAEHVEKIIKPALKEDMTVICDCYTDSTEARQIASGAIPDLGIKAIRQLHKCFPQPNLTIFLQPSLGTLKSRQMTGTHVSENKIKQERNNYEGIIRFAAQEGRNTIVIRDNPDNHINEIVDKITA